MAEVEKLARRLAGDAQTADVLRHARVAAEADLELQRVRRVKVALIERASALGALRPPKHFRSAMQEVVWCQRMDLWSRKLQPTQPVHPVVIQPSDSMPAEEPDRLAEAARRVLGILVKLERYENRAAARQDRAVRAMVNAKAKTHGRCHRLSGRSRGEVS